MPVSAKWKVGDRVRWNPDSTKGEVGVAGIVLSVGTTYEVRFDDGYTASLPDGYLIPYEPCDHPTGFHYEDEADGLEKWQEFAFCPRCGERL